MKKKVLAVLVNSSVAELDWLMPVISYYSKDYYIFTYFKNKKTYETLKKNKALHDIWCKINDSYFIERFYNLFFYKLLRKAFNYLKIKHLSKDYFSKKIHSLDRLKKLIKSQNIKKNFSLDFILSEFGRDTGWIHIISKYSIKRPVIIHYPHSPSAYKKKKNINPRYKLYGDLLLVGREDDKMFFSALINKQKIFACGIPRYAKSWNEKILNNSFLDFNYNKIKNFNIITLAYSSRFDTFKKQKHVLENQLNEVMKIITDLKNTILIIKTHPRKNSDKFLAIVKKYDNKKWILSATHLSKLASISNCVICQPNSAAGLDAVTQNIPAIQLSPIKYVENQNDISEELGFVKRANNFKSLKKLVNISIEQPNDKIWKAQRRNFRKHYPNNNISLKLITKIINNHKKTNV